MGPSWLLLLRLTASLDSSVEPERNTAQQQTQRSSSGDKRWAVLQLPAAHYITRHRNKGNMQQLLLQQAAKFPAARLFHSDAAEASLHAHLVGSGLAVYRTQ